MADEDVLDLFRVEAECRQAVDNLGLGRPGEVRVDDDQTIAGTERPRRMLARAEPVEVVEHLVRRCVPCGAVRRAAGAPPSRGATTCGGCGPGRTWGRRCAASTGRRRRASRTATCWGRRAARSRIGAT